MFYTGSGNSILFKRIPDAMLTFYERNKAFATSFHIIIGSDSQNYADHKNKTKIVTAICLLAKGHGGIYFAFPEYITLIQDIRTKLHTETARSLETADKLLDILTSKKKYEDMYLNCSFSLNIDAGYEDSEYRNPNTHSKTETLIPELVAWVNAMGFEATVKPDSVAASSVANRISK